MTCGDGPLSILDRQAIADVFIGSQPVWPMQCITISPATGGQPATVSLATVAAQPETKVTVQVGLENATEDVRALQLTLQPGPNTVSLRAAQGHRARNGAAVGCRAAGEGRINVALMSLKTATIAPGTGPVLALDLDVTSNVTRDIALDPGNVRIGGNMENELAAPPQAGLIVVQGANTHTGARCDANTGPQVGVRERRRRWRLRGGKRCV